MDKSKIFKIEKMASQFIDDKTRSGFVSGANMILCYLKELVESIDDVQKLKEELSDLINRLEGNTENDTQQ